MRIVKVLYSFDNENKTNCLARWPQSLDIRTAYLDESTQIGVIELKTCIQAIVAASPELVAKLGQDYTVYAYDYSEYETPLVGQGMLSWVLASSSSTPSAPAHQSRTIVTGRVCKNIPGLFSNSSQDTLEVKLRLVPVPTSLQSEYIESMKKYRDISQFMPMPFDPQAWTNFLQANPNFFQFINQSRSQSPAVGSGQTNSYGIEHVQRLMSGDGSTSKSVGSQPSPALNSGNNVQSASNVAQHGVHLTTGLAQHKSFSVPPPPHNSNTQNFDNGIQPPRPSSAASNVSTTTAPKRRGRPPRDKNAPRGRGGRPKKIENILPSGDTGYASNNEGFEEGPNQKRAKVTQTEWSGRMDFGKQPESLRVAASTAASVRIHQPTAVRPGNQLANALEGPPREPTPIADPANRIQRPQLPAQRSSLQYESLIPESNSYASPYAPLKPEYSVTTSPEASQAESSPVDIASSPPVYRRDSTAPPSPNLPSLPKSFNDSGFMSGSMDDLFEDDDMRPIDDEEIEIASHYSRRSNLPMSVIKEASATKSPNPVIGSEQPTLPENLDPKAAAQTRQIERNARLLNRTASSSCLDPSLAPASDLVRPSTLSRSQTWSGHQAQHPASDLDLMPPVQGNWSGADRKGSEGGLGSGARRRQAIQSKLASSVAAGEMPPFCENCGAIETPTWRKAWVKVHTGTPEHVVISEEEGGVISWQTLQTDHEGRVCLYRIIKKSTLRDDVGFTEVLLCNPCGLFLHTRKCMRPREVWERPPNGGDGKRRRDGNNGARQKSNSVSEPGTSKGSDGAALHSDASTPADSGPSEGLEAEPQLPPMHHRRSSSAHTSRSDKKSRILNKASAMAALQRAIKSSPHKFVGTEYIPIEVQDLTPQPTRRILFPSPSQSLQSRSTRSSIAGFNIQTSPQNLRKGPDTKADQSNKENCPPTNDDDEFDQYFEEDAYINAHNARPTTPTPTRSNRGLIFKTPKRSPGGQAPTTGDFFSSAAKALLRPPVTPKRSPTKNFQPLGELTPFTAQLNQMLSDADSGSPGSFPSLPSLHNTPGTRIRSMEFDFSQFDSQDLLSTDVPMPSSPPAWFGVYEDSIENETGSLWGTYQLPGSSPRSLGDVADGTTPKTPGLVVDENGTATVDV